MHTPSSPNINKTKIGKRKKGTLLTDSSFKDLKDVDLATLFDKGDIDMNDLEITGEDIAEALKDLKNENLQSSESEKSSPSPFPSKNSNRSRNDYMSKLNEMYKAKPFKKWPSITPSDLPYTSSKRNNLHPINKIYRIDNINRVDRMMSLRNQTRKRINQNTKESNSSNNRIFEASDYLNNKDNIRDNIRREIREMKSERNRYYKDDSSMTPSITNTNPSIYSSIYSHRIKANQESSSKERPRYPQHPQHPEHPIHEQYDSKTRTIRPFHTSNNSNSINNSSNNNTVNTQASGYHFFNQSSPPPKRKEEHLSLNSSLNNYKGTRKYIYPSISDTDHTNNINNISNTSNIGNLDTSDGKQFFETTSIHFSDNNNKINNSNKLNTLKQTISKQETLQSTLNDKLETLKTTLRNIQGLLKNKQQELKDNKKELIQNEGDIRLLNDSLDEQRRKLNQLEGQVNKKKSYRDMVQNILKGLDSYLDELAKKSKGLDTEIKGIENQLSGVEGDLKRKRGELKGSGQ